MPLLLRGRRRPVRFLFAPAFAGSGTTVMRGAQLAGIARATVLEDRGVSFDPFSETFRSSDLFLTKGVIRSVDESTLRLWKRRGNRLFVDPVDEDLDEQVAARADVIVAASRSAFASYRERWPDKAVALLNHHVDPRAVAALAREAERASVFRCAYFGELVNTVSSPEIEELVDFVLVDTSRPSDGWFHALPRYTMHYAIRRQRALDRHKPFLKGFTAAASSANILIQHSEIEPRYWLPPEYPYWLRGEVTTEAIVRSLVSAREDYGSDRWLRGQEMMQDIARQTTPTAIAAELVALFAR